MNLSIFRRPSRYINNEWNSVHRDGSLRVALCFPDIYEIGMSHLGMKIFYELLNSIPDVVAERFYAPWTDMEDWMRKNGEPLRSLESGRPLYEFDIIGFSLQYELSLTTVLNMLDLGGLGVLSAERRSPLPLIICGGPITVNPAPISKFFDAIFVGDAEEGIIEICDTVKRWKSTGDGRKESLLVELSGIEGVYIPLLKNKTRRRIIKDLDTAPYPVRPIVPYTEIVHDRLNIEISRGCPMGCRFCSAGMIYRPVRERSIERIMDIVEESLRSTGYEEVSFTSLSAGDYSHLEVLLSEFMRRFGRKKISVSLPSLRVGAVTERILRLIRSVKKTGFTIAPEAGSEKLRKVINKNLNEEDYERALNILFKEGWENLKLYYMIGLPDEDQSDIDAIIDMSLRALRIAKRYTGRFVNINVSVAPFVPKPHTPFQWVGQKDLEELKRITAYLKARLEKKGIRYKGHDPHMSLIEAIISRGDERVADLIFEAWRMGSRLDAWTEHFDFKRWLDAMDKTGIDALNYVRRNLKFDEPLPWDFIDTGVKKEYLRREYLRSRSIERSPSCLESCMGCGLDCELKDKREKIKGMEEMVIDMCDEREVSNQMRRLRLRVEYSKTGILRYLSHLETMRAILRALRRGDVQLEYSHGFSPSPRVSFGHALPVGVEGLRECFDMILLSEPGKDVDTEILTRRINLCLPEGLRINRMVFIPFEAPSINSAVSMMEYIIEGVDLKVGDKETGGISIMEKGDGYVRFTAHGRLKLDDILRRYFSETSGEIRIRRTGNFVMIDGKIMDIMEIGREIISHAE